MGIEDLILKLSESIKVSSQIDMELFRQYNVKRGLRNDDHTGVLVGLTKIGNVIGYVKNDKGELDPVDGRLIYRSVDVRDLVRGFQSENRHGFEEAVYLLLSGNLPTQTELSVFQNYLATLFDLPQVFTKDVILDLKGKNLMNMLARSVLSLYIFDENADVTTRENLVNQSLNLIAKMPTIVAYSYQSMRHTYEDSTLSIRHPKPELSIAENFLWMLKGDSYTPLESEIVDLSLVLHAEHGGGNNSSFTTRVISSSGSDTYSAISAAIGSLKGPLHGGANIEVLKMMEHLKSVIHDWENESSISDYLLRMLNKEVYNKTGKIYGIGHAVYTKSDPRAVLLKERARELAKEKNRLAEFEFYERIERLGVQTFWESKGKKIGKYVCANVDFYSGFVYDMIGIPKEIYTPLFAMARVAGWTSHRLEELNFAAKRIIRPAYRNVLPRQDYVSIKDR